MELWSCANGNKKERIRAKQTNKTGGYIIRDFCSKTFKINYINTNQQVCNSGFSVKTTDNGDVW